MLNAANFSRDKLQAALSAAEAVGKSQLEANGAEGEPEEPGHESAEPDRKQVPAGPFSRRADLERECKSDPWVLLKRYEPIISVLPSGSFGKALPYKCVACQTRRNPEGKIGDLVAPTFRAVYHFLFQHLDSHTHQQNMARRNLEVMEVEPELVACPGLRIGDRGTSRSLVAFEEQFDLWASMANFGSRMCKHKYWKDANLQKWFVRSQACSGTCPRARQGPSICQHCLNLGTSKSIVRSAVSFALKYYMGELLSLRIFASEKEKDQFEAKLKMTAMYQQYQSKVDEILALDVPKMQQYVRGAILCDSQRSPVMERWVQCTVVPAVKVNVGNVPPQLSELSAKFAAMIAGNMMEDEQQMANIKVAAAAINGTFDQHALILGLALQCKRQCEKAARGISTMSGRRSKESEHEHQMIADAGIQLACASGNSHLAREFGLSAGALRMKVDELKLHSLPTPCLAANWPEVVADNFDIINLRFPLAPGGLKSNLAHL